MSASDASVLNTANLAALTGWITGKTLVVTAETITSANNIDVSTVGDLVIAGALTLSGAHALTASAPTSGAGNVTVSEGGSIVLDHNGATLAGKIKVNGRIKVGNITTAAIPATVDLSEGTIKSTNDNASFTFAAGAVSLDTIDVANSLAITGATGLTVGTITNVGAASGETLTLPAGTATVTSIKADGTSPLTISGASGTILKSANVSDAAGLVFGDTNVLLSGDVAVASNSSITAAAANFGADATAKVARIGKISGGAITITDTVDTPADIAAIAAVTTANVTVSSGATDLSGVADFVVAAGNVITLSAAVTDVPAVIINGTLKLTAASTFATAGIITVNGTFDVGSSAIGLAPQDNITVGAGSVIKLVASGKLTVAADKTFTLTGAAGTGGAKLMGEGKLTAGKTEITGGVGGWWQAVGASGTVTIAAASTDTATITASANTVEFTAGGEGATITQLAGNGNALTIGVNTTIALGGDGAKVGEIVLTGANDDPGKLAFANAGTGDVGTSLVTTGATSADNKVIGTVSEPATGKTNVVWYAANATNGGKWSKVGVSDASGVITGGGNSTNVSLSGETTVTAS